MQSAFEFLQTRKRKLKLIKRRRVYKSKLLRGHHRRDQVRTTYGCDTWAHEYSVKVSFNGCEVRHIPTGELVAFGDAYDMRNLCLELND